MFLWTAYTLPNFHIIDVPLRHSVRKNQLAWSLTTIFIYYYL